ncbi:MAG: cofactor-independent phosphoglycerate mutase [Clostridia bacterium]|nr:cofactor-independent phosphoglycerate mutase [Clostridia bacterium]
MKYAVIVCDGMSDRTIAQLGNKTPMALAYKPNIDALAQKGEAGLVKTVSADFRPGNDVAHLSVLGYDPKMYYTGLSPFEAAGSGIDLKDDDVALRCNFVTLSDEESYEDKIMLDYSADDISSAEAEILIEYIEEKLGNEIFRFYNGSGYRHCLVWTQGEPRPGVLTPPRNITEKKITDYIPKGDFVAPLYDLMRKSYELLKEHPINSRRSSEGKKPANSVWLWGEGMKPHLDSFSEKFDVSASVISDVDLLNGIGRYADMTVCRIADDYEMKAQTAVNELKRGQDLVYIHTEAPDQYSYHADIENKIKSIELIDKYLVGYIVNALRKMGEEFSVMILSAISTPTQLRTHTSDPVPYLIYRSNDEKTGGVEIFDEYSAFAAGLYVSPGYNLMNRFLQK